MIKKFVEEEVEVKEVKKTVKPVSDVNAERLVDIKARNEARRLEGEVALAKSVEVSKTEAEIAKLASDKVKLEVDRVELVRQEAVLKKMQENFDSFKKGVEVLEKTVNKK